MWHFPPFKNPDKCRPEADGDAICGMALDYVGADVPAGFGESWLNRGQIIRLCPTGPALRTFVQHLITFCSLSVAADDVISSGFVEPVLLHKDVKFHGPSFNCSREIQAEAVRGGIFDCFPYNFRLEVYNDVVSRTAIDNVGGDVLVKFGDSMSNSFRDIRGADFVSNEHDREYPNSAGRLSGISPKNNLATCQLSSDSRTLFEQ